MQLLPHRWSVGRRSLRREQALRPQRPLPAVSAPVRRPYPAPRCSRPRPRCAGGCALPCGTPPPQPLQGRMRWWKNKRWAQPARSMRSKRSWGTFPLHSPAVVARSATPACTRQSGSQQKQELALRIWQRFHYGLQPEYALHAHKPLIFLNGSDPACRPCAARAPWRTATPVLRRTTPPQHGRSRTDRVQQRS